METYLKHLDKKERKRVIEIYRRVLKTCEDDWVFIEFYAKHAPDFTKEDRATASAVSNSTVKKLLALNVVDYGILQQFLTECMRIQKDPGKVIIQLKQKEW